MRNHRPGLTDRSRNMAFAVISQAQGFKQWQVRFYRVVQGRKKSSPRLASEVTCEWPMVLALVGPPLELAVRPAKRP